MNLRDTILALDDLSVSEPIEVPEWSATVYVRSLNGAEFIRLTQLLDADTPHNYAEVVALCACEPNGTRLFSDDDVEALSGKSFRALQRIAEAGIGHNFSQVDDAGKD
jgi:hypothetical protein